MSNEAAARPSSAPPGFAGGGFNISRPRWNIAERLAKRVGAPILPERDEEDEAQAGDGADRANGQDDFPPGHLKHPIAAEEQPQDGEGEDQNEGGQRDHAAAASSSMPALLAATIRHKLSGTLPSLASSIFAAIWRGGRRWSVA